MPALLAYLIAVALLLGGGYGALSWLATPEPVKVVAKATPKPPSHEADNSKPDSTRAPLPRVSPPAPSKPGIGETGHVKAAANDGAVSSDQPPSESSSSRPPAAASRQDAKAEASDKAGASDPAQDHQNGPAQVEMPQAANDQEAKPHVEAPPAQAKQDDLAPATHNEQQQSTQAASPGNAQTVASIAPAAAAKTAKRPHVRQASRGSGKRSLQVMTLRIIELPNGRRMTQLIPYRGGDRYRDDGPAMAFDPDE